MSNENLKEKILNEAAYYPKNKFARFVLSPPEIYTTEELIIPGKNLKYTGGVAISPNTGLHIIMLAIIVLIPKMMIDDYIEKANLKFPTILIYPILFLIGYIIYRFIKPLHRKIIIDHNGITIRDHRFEWKNILQTFILTTGNTKVNIRKPTVANFLIIVDTQERISKFEITFASERPEMLSTIIEYYKKKNA